MRKTYAEQGACVQVLTLILHAILIGTGTNPPQVHLPEYVAAEEHVALVQEDQVESLYEGRLVWDDLADCESGEWSSSGQPLRSTARWNLAPGAHIFEGGLQFHPRTWDWLAGEVLGDGAPPSAHLATRVQQIRVAEEVLRRQGWQAWPVCSRKLGLRQ